MINSTRCPLCVDGIGHDMDDKHAAVVKELVKALKYALEVMGPLGVNADAQSPIKQAIAKAEGK
jgi:hypothetical protein